MTYDTVLQWVESTLHSIPQVSSNLRGTMKFKQLIASILILVSITPAYADTPPPGTVKAKMYDSAGVGITSSTAGLKQGLDVFMQGGAVTASVTSSPASPLFAAPVFGGAAIDPRTRQWSLLNSTDSITAFQGGAPWTIGLPTGASTEAKQDTGNTSLSSIDTKLSSQATAANQTTGNASLSSIDNKLKTGINNTANSVTINVASDQAAIPITGSITASNASIGLNGAAIPLSSALGGAKDGSGNLQPLNITAGGALVTDSSATTQPISASALPLPSGASTSALQTSGNGSLSTIVTNTTGLSTEATLALIKAKTDNIDVALSTRTKPLDTQIVDGSAVTQPISAAALPLPSGAATSADQVTAQASLTSIDSKLTAPLATTVASLPLPAGAATSALQTTGNSSLSSIDTNLTNGTQQTKITNGTNTASILPNGDGTFSLQVAQSATNFIFSGSNVTNLVLAPATTYTSACESSTNQQALSMLLTSDQSGTFTINQYIDAACTLVAATRTFSITAGTGFSRSIPYNGNYAKYSFTNTSGSPTAALNINVAFGTLPPTTNAGNQPVSLDEINGTSLTVGQKTSALSIPVVIASDQSSIAVKGSSTALVQSAVPAPRGVTALVTTPAPQNLFRTTFASVLPSTVDPTFFSTINIGTGQTVSQSNGSLLLTAGTTANSETILRSTQTFSGPMIARVQNILSQRIINDNFFVELVDVIGDSLATTVNSATSITVTIPSNTFTSANVGQSMYVGNVNNISATAVSGRYAIASVAGNNVTFTVAGWPASGSGTVSLFGWNYYQQQFTGATATSVNYDAQRRGWNSGVTAATINTTASPGTMTIMNNEDGNAFLSDQLVASSATNPQTIRASRVINLPDENATLYLQLRSVNGSTAPLSNTTWTLGTISVENYSPVQTTLNNVKVQGIGSSLPTQITNIPATTINSGTITTVSTVSSVSSVASNQSAIPGIIADIASAAITTTTTTATLVPTFGSSYQVNIPVTVVSGTNPTLDVQIQESADTGTNWYAVYDFPRITATGSYNSPVLPLTGNRIRYVQTVTGTTPSFTRAINRLQGSRSAPQYRQLINRSIDPVTTNSVTPSLFVEGNGLYTMIVTQGAGGTPVTFALDGSNDGTNWVNGITSVAGVISTPVVASTSGTNYKFLRGRVVTGVAATTISNLTLIASDSPPPAGGSGGTVTANIGTTGGLALDATVSSMSAKLPTALGAQTTTASMAVNIASDQTVNVAAASLPLPSGASTSANQTTANGSLSSIDGKLNSLGQKAMAASAPVVISSDQSAIPSSQSGTWNINNVSGTVSLPTGAATSANQTTANSSLSNIDTNTSKQPINTTGSGSAAAATVSTVITLTAPANAVGFVLMNLGSSTDNIRYGIGRTATTTLGQRLEPGRDTGFIPCGANVSLVAEAGTQDYDIQWISQ